MESYDDENGNSKKSMWPFFVVVAGGSGGGACLVCVCVYTLICIYTTHILYYRVMTRHSSPFSLPFACQRLLVLVFYSFNRFVEVYIYIRICVSGVNRHRDF